MKELILLMASVMDRDAIVTELKKNIEKYEADKTDDNFNGMTAFCMIAAAKQTTEKQSLSSVLRDMEQMDKAHELLKTRVH